MQMIERVTHIRWTWMSLEHPPQVIVAKKTSSGLGIGPWEPFRLAKY
jgi:hypothetical protein